MGTTWTGYGAKMLPVPEENLTILTGGERILDGAFEVQYTPGHAPHHVSFLHAGTAYAGDAGGVRIAGSSMAIPPTPPPDIDLPAWHESIAKLRAWEPERVAITHFGDTDAVTEHLDELEGRLDEWAELARTAGRDGFVAAVQAEILRNVGPDTAETYERAAPVQLLYSGYKRYWERHG